MATITTLKVEGVSCLVVHFTLRMASLEQIIFSLSVTFSLSEIFSLSVIFSLYEIFSLSVIFSLSFLSCEMPRYR